MRVHARLSFIVTTNLPSFVTLIRCFISRSKPLGQLEEFGQAVFHKEVKIQRSLGTPSEGFWSLLRSWPHRGISQEKLPIYLGFFQFVHNVRRRGKALLDS